MTFLHAGLAIAGLAAVSIPIIIHLISRRRRTPIEWAAMRFLLEAFRKHRRRLQLEQLLLLLARCLVVALLGFALARPLLDASDIPLGHGGRNVLLIIDNGMCAQVAHDEDGTGTAFAEHVRRAREIVDNLSPRDAVGLIGAARPASMLAIPPTTDHLAIERLLSEMRPTDAPSDLPGALRLARETIDSLTDDRDRTVVYLLTEFRRGSVHLDQSLPGHFAELTNRVALSALPPAPESIENVQVVEVNPVRSILLAGQHDGAGQIVVRLRRFGELIQESTRVSVIAAWLGAGEVTAHTVQWQPGQSEQDVDFLLNMPGAMQRDETLPVEIRIENDRLRADNSRTALLEARQRLRVTLLDRPEFRIDRRLDRMTAGQWMRRALQPGEMSAIEVIAVEPSAFDVRDLRATDVVVASRPDLLTDNGWSLLADFVNSGGLLFISPPGEQTVHQWADRMTRLLGLDWTVEIETEIAETDSPFHLGSEQPASELFRMIAGELGEMSASVTAWRRMAVRVDQTDARVVLHFTDGAPAIVSGTLGETATPDRDSALGESDAANQEIGRHEATGLVVFSTIAPELTWTNLPTQPLMVPLMQEIVRQGLSMLLAERQYEAGSRPALIGAGRSRAAIEVRTPTDRTVTLDEHGRPMFALREAGLYQLIDAGGTPVGTIPVNVDPNAGDTTPQSESAVMNWLTSSGSWQFVADEDFTAGLRDIQDRRSLAGILLGAVLALLVLELVMARYFSHAFASDSAKDKFGSAATGRT